MPPGCVRLTLAVIVGLLPRAGAATQRKCLFSLTDLNAIWLSVANSVVLIQEMISPEDLEKQGSKDSYFIQHFSSTSCSAGGLTTTVSNWPCLDRLCSEGMCLLPTKTHILRCNWFTWWSRCLWYNSRQFLYLETVERLWGKFLSSSAFFLGLWTLILKQSYPTWEKGLRGVSPKSTSAFYHFRNGVWPPTPHLNAVQF